MKKERLYIHTLIDDPVLTYPAYYLLSAYQHTNETLKSTIIALHSGELDSYTTPSDYKEIFSVLGRGEFALFKENYIIGHFGNRLMYLASDGWHGMSVTEDTFEMENWRI